MEQYEEAHINNTWLIIVISFVLISLGIILFKLINRDDEIILIHADSIKFSGIMITVGDKGVDVKTTLGSPERVYTRRQAKIDTGDIIGDIQWIYSNVKDGLLLMNLRNNVIVSMSILPGEIVPEYTPAKTLDLDEEVDIWEERELGCLGCN